MLGIVQRLYTLSASSHCSFAPAFCSAACIFLWHKFLSWMHGIGTENACGDHSFIPLISSVSWCYVTCWLLACRWAYSQVGWAHIASLAPVVIMCAEQGDPTAVDIVYKAVRELNESLKTRRGEVSLQWQLPNCVDRCGFRLCTRCPQAALSQFLSINEFYAFHASRLYRTQLFHSKHCLCGEFL